MHESSIAQSLLELAEKHLREKGMASISSLRVRVGKLSGVMPEALLFAFEALKGGTPASSATLCIEGVPPGGECAGCGGEFEFEGPYVLECPRCGGVDFKVTKGRELELAEMEVD